MTYNPLIKPFIKWVGGKRQLLDELEKRIPYFDGKYYEPFIGGGAVLFRLQRKNVLINDYNEELINTYLVIRDNLEELFLDLDKHENTSEYFYEIRALDREFEVYNKLSDVERASRFIFLNKTCFNGLYRVNKSGFFNTPYGKYKNPNYKDIDTLTSVSNYLNKSNVQIKNMDFEEAVKYSRKGSFVYFDPPYDPISSTSNFTGYIEGGFDRKDQIRLRNLCDRLDKKNVKFMVSNSDTEFIKEIYKNYNIDIVKATRSINSNGAKRGLVGEVIITNYKV